MEDIIIDGVNLNDLKVKYDALAAEQAALRNSIRKGASKFISDTLEQGKELVQSLINAEDEEEINVEEVSKKAYDLMSTVKFVSDVAGIAYTIPYYDRQSDYYPDGDSYTSQLEDCAIGESESESFGKLWGLLEDMESDVSDWNTSYC